MKYYDEEGDFEYVFIDDIPTDNLYGFMLFLQNKPIPEPINGRGRAYWSDYKYWWYNCLE